DDAALRHGPRRAEPGDRRARLAWLPLPQLRCPGREARQRRRALGARPVLQPGRLSKRCEWPAVERATRGSYRAGSSSSQAGGASPTETARRCTASRHVTTDTTKGRKAVRAYRGSAAWAAASARWSFALSFGFVVPQ